MLPVTLLLLLSSYDTVLALPVYNLTTRQMRPVTRLDPPSFLQRRHNITCVGEAYDLALPLQKAWNPNAVSVQRLCAKSSYGGSAPDQNIGGWCNDHEIVFDHSADQYVDNQLRNPRMKLGCRYRCFCNLGHEASELSVQPRPNELNVAPFAWSMKSYQTYEVELDVVDDFTTPARDKRGRQGNRMVPTIRTSNIQESLHYENLYAVHDTYISLDYGNYITCQGPLPTFSLPSPYSTSDFANLQQLCATQLNDGLQGANAGGFCYRSDAIENGGQTIWFSDEMTPRLEWTWNGGNFRAAASIRFHCFRYCQCTSSLYSGKPTNTTYLKKMWQFVAGAQLVVWPSGQVNVQPTASTTASTSRPVYGAVANSFQQFTILPEQNGTGSPSGTCGPDGKQFCAQPWPSSLLGPIPRSPPNATDVVRPGPNPGTNNNLTVCGNQCTGPQDCGAGDDEEACTCALPSSKDAQALGLDPVFPVAVCLALMYSSFGKGLKVPHGLKGRGEELLNGEGQPWQCLCNATFVHSECCGSRDGMVWLD